MTSERDSDRDLGPLPAVHERQAMVNRCSGQLSNLVEAWCHEGLTTSEVFMLLTGELFSMSRYLVNSERRQAREGQTHGPD